MNECDRTCDALRQDIARLRNHHMQVKADARCAFTNKPVVTSGEPFYVFPSGYVFLESALRREVMPYLNDKQRSRVSEVEHELKMTPRHNISRRNLLRAELDGLIAAECPLTGSIMVESIDRPFEEDL
jgi:hypothetical protein